MEIKEGIKLIFDYLGVDAPIIIKHDSEEEGNTLYVDYNESQLIFVDDKEDTENMKFITLPEYVYFIIDKKTKKITSGRVVLG